MFNVTGGEFLIIFLVALVVLGPTKLPEAARQVGKIVGEFRRISSGFQRELQSAMNDPVSKVTGEATPKTLKDVTSIAEVPPLAAPATPTTNDSADGSSSADDSTPSQASRPVANTAAVEQADSLDSDKPFTPTPTPTSPTTDTSGTEIAEVALDPESTSNPTNDPPMYGDR